MADDGQNRRQRLLPATPLGRVRLAAVCYAAISVATISPQLNGQLPVSRQLLGLGAGAWLIVTYVVTYTRKRVIPLEPIVSAAAVVVVGSSLNDPFVTFALCIVTLATQSLYGSWTSAIARLVALSIALPVAVASSPVSSAVPGGPDIPTGPGSPNLVGTVPGFVLTMVLMRTLLSTLSRQERITAREHLLVNAGTRMLDLTDSAEVRAVSNQTATDLCHHCPGVGVVLLDVGAETATVTGVAALPGLKMGMTFPVRAFAPAGSRTDESRSDAIERLDELVGRRRWRKVSIDAPPEHWLMLVGARRHVPDEIMDSYHMLATQRSQAEARCRSHGLLEHQARHDSLTALANRRELIKRLSEHMAASRTGRDVGIILIDLDDFKLINDTYGHPSGDELLVAVGGRLREVAAERGLAARLGGDEFALMIVGTDAEGTTPRVANEVHQLLHMPVRLPGVTINPSASIGMAVGEPQMAAADLMRHADIAMYWAKARGKSRVDQYAPAEHGDVADIRELEADLDQAVERGEIMVHYQPLVDMAFRHCVGVEALARWQHPVKGLLLPTMFLPMAERNGQIAAIGTHLLRTACLQAARWITQPGKEELRVSVNLAPRQLLEPGLTNLVRSTLAETGLPAHLLTLELTDTTAVDDDLAVRQLHEMADMGVRISIDDFGRGQTSLSTLDRFPVHQIKIDRSFLVPREDANAEGMLRLVISAPQILDLETVADIAKTEEKADTAHLAGQPLARGFLFANPMTAPEFETWHSRTLHSANSSAVHSESRG